MPRYCAVKLCNNRGGIPSKDNKRISFYPFPLHDKARLKKWIVNMKRGEWTPSRHQYLCSEHFTEDSFDLRWGIRYLKHTAIPTIFPFLCDNEPIQSKKKNKPKKRPPDPGVRLAHEPLGQQVPSVIREMMPVSHTHVEIPFQEALSTESSTEADLSNHGVPLPESCAQTHGEEHHQQCLDSGSVMTFLCCDTTGLFEEETCSMGSPSGASLAAEGEEKGLVADTTRARNAALPGDGGASSLCEHSYSRQDMDKEQLWSRIASLHAKVLTLDQQEERTLAKITCVEREIEQLQKRNAVCQQRQKVLEDYFTSVFL